MKKLLLIFCILASIFGSSIFAQTWVEDVYLNEDFSTATGSWVDGTLTQGYWTGATQSTTNTFTSAVNTTNKNVEIKTNVKIGNFVNNIKTFSGTGAPYSSPSGKVTVSFIVKIGAAQTYSGAYFYFRDNSNKPIFGLGFARINSGGNKWLAVKPTVYTEWVTGAAANYANITTPALLPTAVDGPGLKVNVVMDFTNHTYSMTATQGTYTANASPEWVDASPANVYTGTDIAFLDNAASNLSNILFEANGLQTSSSATATNFTFDNFKIAGEKTAAVASVTINYKDSEGNVLKSPRMQPDLEVGSTYTAPASDKETFSDASFYYAYNAATSTDNVVVAEGAVINLIFKKTPLTSGIYIWSGNANSNWNSADENFSVGTSPFIGYQDNNPILFPAVPVTKTVNLNANLTAGANDITMYGNGYSFSGTGSISGTGKFILGMQPGETATLGIKNNMSAYDINGGEAVITNNLGSAVYNLADGVKITLQTGAEFNKAITGTGTVTIQTNSNVFYNNTLTGPSTVNLILGVSGSLTGGVNWSSKVLTAMPANAQVNVTTNQATAGYGVAANSVQNSKLFLGDKVRLLYNYNPNEGGTTIISIGELTGAASASIEGGWVNSGTRGLNYYIGGLGTDATYNGVFKNYSSAPTAPLNIFKKGLGILTLISANPDWLLGNFNVDEGTIVLNGSIPGSAVPVTVATGAIIKGTGTVGGPATINGTLEGSLHFGSTLALNGKTNLIVSGFNSGEYDVITVTGAVTNGGTLNIAILASAPAVNTTIKLINAGSYAGTFSKVTFPAGYSFNESTGELTYTGKSTWSGSGNWSESAYWIGNSVPSNGLDILVQSGELTIDVSPSVSNIIIAPGAKLTLNDTKTLSAASLTIQSNASGTGTFVDKNSNGGLTVSGTGTTNVEQYLSGDGRQWWYLASPVSGASSDVFSPSGSLNKIGEYVEDYVNDNNETTTVPYYASPFAAGSATSLSIGKGYVVKLSSSTGGTYNFTGGSLNTGDVPLAPTRTGTTAGARGFNLVGNPYPSFLDWNSTALVKTNLRPSIWYRTLLSGSATGAMTFDTFDGSTGTANGQNGEVSQYIPPMQAFWVKVNADGDVASLVFKNTARSHQDQSTAVNRLRVPSQTKSEIPIVRLKVSNGIVGDEAIIVGDNNASDLLDAYDSDKMSNNSTAIPEIFTLAGTQELVINHLNSISADKELPLGFRPGQTGNFTITATQLENIDTKVMLLDKQAVKEQELTAESPYSFTVTDAAPTNDRFVISFVSRVPTGVEINGKAGDLMVYSNINNRIQLIYRGELTERTAVSVYNVAGQMLSTQKLVKATNELSGTFNPGVYMIRVKDGNLSITKKLIIR